MRNIRQLQRAWCSAVAVSLAAASLAAAEPPAAQGFALERYAPAAPAAGWLVMDRLDLSGNLGAGVTLTTGYARNAYAVANSTGTQPLHVVANQAFVNVGMALLFRRYRLSLNISDPLYVSGKSGLAAGHQFTAPFADPGLYPDKVTDFRLGVDTVLLGDATGPLRLGLGAQLWVPSGERNLYATDGTWRAVFRVLAAGDSGVLTYAAYLGVHLRPLNEAGVPGAPRGHELLFGLAAGPRLVLSEGCQVTAMLGPELFGATALNDTFGKYTSAVEALFTGSLQRVDAHGAHQLFKVGFGGGLNPQFGAPEWRAVAAIEIHDRVN